MVAYIHISGVGLLVVRSTGIGNATASVFGTAACDVLTLFAFYVLPVIHTITAAESTAG